jgi:hypothetical protein
MSAAFFVRHPSFGHATTCQRPPLRRREATDRGRGRARGRENAGRPRPEGDHGWRVPPSLVAHGLHLSNRRHYENSSSSSTTTHGREDSNRCDSSRPASSWCWVWSRRRNALEKKDDLKRRIDEASKFVPVDQLCLSPQCGFSSTVEGNALTIEEQKAKLRLIVETADEVWGTLGAQN